jgi:ABC-type transport system involved in multi-copper enzyme maturation permease subunit
MTTPIFFILFCLLAALLYLVMTWLTGFLLGFGSSPITAVAKVTFSHAIRMKIAIVVLILLIVLLPLMSMIIDGDGTLIGKLQTFASYGLGLIGFLLSILTIAISCFTLSNDLRRKHLYLTVTKPIRRFELLLGKLLGTVLLNVILLTLFGSILYAGIVIIPRIADATPEQVVKAEHEFFTARIGLKPELDYDAMRQKARERFQDMQTKRQLPEGMSLSRVMAELQSEELMKAKSVAPGGQKVWEFHKVRIDDLQNPDAVIFIRYKYQTSVEPPDGQVYGQWRVGDLRQKGPADARTQIYGMDGQEATRTVHEFAVPADAVAEDGYLAVAFRNNPSMNRTVIIPEEVEVLYRTGNFSGNYLRSVLLMFVQLTFLSILGISLTTCLSFPISILISVSVFFVGLINFFIVDAVESVGESILTIYSYTIKPALWLLPHFDQMYQPSWYIVDGRTLEWTFLLSTIGITLCIKGLLLLAAGMLIFSRREVAKAVV